MWQPQGGRSDDPFFQFIHKSLGDQSVATTARATVTASRLRQAQITALPLPKSTVHPTSQKELTSMVVTMSVLLASVSETLMSRLVEFIAKVLLEYQIPI